MIYNIYIRFFKDNKWFFNIENYYFFNKKNSFANLKTFFSNSLEIFLENYFLIEIIFVKLENYF